MRIKVFVMDNVVRPDFSCGHLSRSWNLALINGFKDLGNPECDLLILMQNDTFVEPFIFGKLVHYQNYFDFIQIGAGDQLMSFTPNAVKRIGIFDERFNSIGFQEADYFLRAYIFNKTRISINDHYHGRVHNPLNENLILPEHSLNNQSYKISDAYGYHDYNFNLFKNKWGIHPEHWNNIDPNLRPKVQKFMLYPYFEKKIVTLQEQNYFL